MRALLLLFSLLAARAFAQEGPAPAPAPAPAPPQAPVLGTDHGTTKGYYDSAPEWGLGVQLGTRGASGIKVQKMAFHDGALELGLGFGGGVASVYGDFVMFLGHDWELAALPEAGGYNQTRGQLMPYLGAGLMVAEGLSLHVPVGIQYTMLKDPLNFYAGGVLAYGLIEGQRIELRLQALAGARLLL